MTVEEMIIEKIGEIFKGDASGHDLYHTLRVYKTALMIAENEECNKNIVALGALLHDTDDAKLFDTENYSNARRIMAECSVDKDTAEAVIGVISTVSFKDSHSEKPKTIEGMIVQDADRLDAIGAVGIARAFAYGGNRGRAIHDPDKISASTTDHFYEKLFLLKDLMNTETAKKLAAERDKFMHSFMDEFLDEWDLKK